MGTHATRTVAVALAAALMLSGCTTVRVGTALRDPNVDPAQVNPALLDPGRFPTKPRPALGTAGDEQSGKLVEARRMAEALVLPFEVDPAIYNPDQINGPLRSPEGLSTTFYYGVPFGATPHNFVTGVIGMAKADNYTTDLANVLMRFATPEDAAAAAADMAKRTQQPYDALDRAAMREVPTPDHPGSVVVESTDQSWSDVYGFTPIGPFVVAQSASAPKAEDAIRVVLGTIDKQRAALEKFTPTAVDKLAALPVDEPGLLARTLPVPPNALNAERFGLYGPHGALNFMDDPNRDQTLFGKTGLEWMVRGVSNVYQVRDRKAADELATAWTTATSNKNFSRAEGVPGMPSSRCLLAPKSDYSSKPRIYYCLAPVDRYLIEVSSADENDAHQKVAAQYMMLTSK